MKVYWQYNSKQYSGELLEREEVLQEADAKEWMEGKPLDWKPVNKVTYSIKGDDGKRYAIDERELYFEPIKN